MITSDLQLFDSIGFTLVESHFVPRSVIGPDKVAQRLLYYLLMPTGTIPGQPGVGTDFLSAVRTFRSEFDMFVAFAAAEPAAARSVQACELPTDPATERYGYSQLSGVAIIADQVKLTLVVAAANGATPQDPVAFVIDI
jgi:hypothetical protein